MYRNRVLTEYVFAGAAVISTTDHVYDYEFHAGRCGKSGEEAGGGFDHKV